MQTLDFGSLQESCISLRSGCHAVTFQCVEPSVWIILARTLADSEIGQYSAGAQCVIRFVTEDRKYVSVFTLDIHDCHDAALKAVRDSFSDRVARCISNADLGFCGTVGRRPIPG